MSPQEKTALLLSGTSYSQAIQTVYGKNAEQLIGQFKTQVKPL
jgi:hypothetical protein